MPPCGSTIRWSRDLFNSKRKFNIFKLKEVRAKQKEEANQLRELDDALLSSLYQQFIYSDSCRSKHIEERFSNALSPHNHTGEGDVCDIWISYHNDFAEFYSKLETSFRDKKNVPHLDKIINDGFFCQSIRQGFGVEVKCSRTGNFPIAKTQGEAILSRFDKYCDPDKAIYLSLHTRLKVTESNRWSDFYLFVELNDKIDIPENCIESVILVPTYKLDGKHLDKKKLSISKAKAIGKIVYTRDMDNIDWKNISTINSAIRLGIETFISSDSVSKNIIERKVKLDSIKFTCYVENEEMMNCKKRQKKYEDSNKHAYSDKLRVIDLGRSAQERHSTNDS